MRRILAFVGLWLALALGAPAQATPFAWTTVAGCSTAVKIVAFTSGTTATIPADYCGFKEVDAIGNGGAGLDASGGGGGGGGFAKLTGNLVYAPNQSVTIQIGTNASPALTCWSSCATLAADYGKGGGSGVGGAGGTANVGNVTFNGGTGGATNGGGGGAAGPNGNGVSASGSVGGAGDNGSGGSGGASINAAGGAGAEYSLTAGGSAGSGGGGGEEGNGGAYGGGGGGCPSFCGAGAGAPGVIILQYYASH